LFINFGLNFNSLQLTLSTSSPTDSKFRTTLNRLDRFSHWTDSNIRVPFTSFRFGLSPLIGLIPGVGDFAGLILSLYVLHEARKVGAAKSLQRKIIQNMLIEFTVGLIPILGDAFDAVFKANTRNTELLRRYLYSELGEEPKLAFPWMTFIWFCVLITVLGWILFRLV
jgi:hypothetical protein